MTFPQPFVIGSLACAIALCACNPAQSPSTTEQSASSASSQVVKQVAAIRNVSVKSGDRVTSGMEVSGEARGTFFSEGVFPVELLDENGTVLAQASATADGEWMTEDFVPFTVTLTFSTATTKGTLVLKKDNPSGLAEHDESMQISVAF